jgi:hypothetical protein
MLELIDHLRSHVLLGLTINPNVPHSLLLNQLLYLIHHLSMISKYYELEAILCKLLYEILDAWYLC